MEEKQNGGAGEAAELTRQEPEAGGKKRRNRKTIVRNIVLLLIFVLLALGGYIYYRGVAYYRTHFFPNTSINGMDCSDMEIAPIVKALDAGIDSYVFTAMGRDYRTGKTGEILGTIEPGDIQLRYTDTEAAVEAFLAQQNELMWFQAYLEGNYTYSLEQAVVFDGEMLKDAVESWDACKKKNMREAEDAYIGGYSDELGCYQIVPETHGTVLDVNEAIRLISEAIDRQEASIDLDGQGCYREASVKSDDKKLNQVIDTANRWLSATIVYDWNGTEVRVDREVLKDWVSIKDSVPELDEEAVAAFVKEQASAYDTYGKKKKFMTTHGFEVTLSSRNYGWRTDTAGEAEELVQLIYQGKSIEKEPLYSITARQKGANDVGNSYVEADLSNQHLYLYQDGKIVVETDFVSGTMISTFDCVTPEGIFGLTYKTKDAVLKGATYRTPVKYWMPFYGNYGMHDANWRGSFGGEIFKTNGSHGCINLPPSMAEQVYQYVSEGFPVVCYYSQGIPYVGPPVVPVPGEGIPAEGIPQEGAPAEGIPQEGIPAEQPSGEGIPIE